MTARVCSWLLTLIALTGLAPDLAAGANEFTVTGRFEYVDKEWDYGGWTGEDPVLPVRYADVVIVDQTTGSSLGRGFTDGDGEFAVVCRSKKPAVTLRARVEADNSRWARSTHGVPRLRVTNNSKVLYAATSLSVVGHDTSADVDVGVSTLPPVLSGSKDGQPFNIFDMGMRSFELIAGPEIGSTTRVRSMRLHWPNAIGRYALGHRAWVSSSDGYDDAVILHEIGHVVHNLYSDSDNPGGIHYFGDSDQNPRLSFGEGYATAFAGMVLDDMGREALYVDSLGQGQLGGYQLHLRLETAEPYAVAALGASDEVAVACVLYDLIDDEHSVDATPGVDDESMLASSDVSGLSPHQAWWRVFRKPIRRARNLTMNDAWDGWLKLHDDDPEYGALRDAYEDREMRFWNDAAEPDDVPALATLVEPDGTWIGPRTLYSSSGDSPTPGPGDRDWFAVDVVAGQRLTVETRYPSGIYDAATQVDPHLSLYTPSGKLVGKDDDAGFGRNARLTTVPVTETGRWTLQVRSVDRMHRYGRYELRVQVD